MMTLFLSYISLGLALLLIVMSSLFSEFKFRRLILICMFAVSLVAGYVVLTDLLSRPKPIEMFWNAPPSETAYVLGYWWKENEAIYLLLKVPEFDEPRYYKFPWSIETAEKLQAAGRDATTRGRRGFFMNNPFGNTVDDKNIELFYAKPQQAPPEKTPIETEIIDILPN